MSSYSAWRGGNQHPLILETILRTLARVRLLANAIRVENLADELAKHGYDKDIVHYQADYLNDLVELLKKASLARKREWSCGVCGRDFAPLYKKSNAKYCSRRCRQKAYRKRQIARHGRQAKRNEVNKMTDIQSPVTVQP